MEYLKPLFTRHTIREVKQKFLFTIFNTGKFYIKVFTCYGVFCRSGDFLGVSEECYNIKLLFRIRI